MNDREPLAKPPQIGQVLALAPKSALHLTKTAQTRHQPPCPQPQRLPEAEVESRYASSEARVQRKHGAW